MWILLAAAMLAGEKDIVYWHCFSAGNGGVLSGSVGGVAAEAEGVGGPVHSSDFAVELLGCAGIDLIP